MAGVVENFINGVWMPPQGSDEWPVMNPATGARLATARSTPRDQVAHAASMAAQVFNEWRRVPVGDRIGYLFRLRQLVEENLDNLARSITEECGKTINESVGEVRRGIENIETACGMPMLIQGYNNEDIARGIDEHMFRQPLGVVAAITPFNFPAMIPLWFLPYAVAAGNCFILKPSERVPITAGKLFHLIERAGFPAGVVQLVNGSKETVDAILDDEHIRAISFVGSTPTARYVYSRAGVNGKRAQCQGGAKNPVVILPDADMDGACRIISDSAFGCAGQRCLATSIAITVGDARDRFTAAITESAATRKVGYGLDTSVDMGPVITPESRERIVGAINRGEQHGAKIRLDGRDRKADGYEDGNWVFPTVLDGVSPNEDIAKTEIFGPVLGLIHARDVDEAITAINGSAYGNMACIFTRSGASARQFRSEVNAGNIGVNVGVAAPMAYFPFSGWKESFFGDLHAQGRHAVEFYTETKVVVERWPDEWSRKF